MQTGSFSVCERNWSMFALIHTKQQNRLALTIDYLNLLEVGVNSSDEYNDPLYMWVRPAPLYDTQENLDPQVVSDAQAEGINVEHVIHEEIISSSSSSDGDHSMNSFKQNLRPHTTT